MNLPIEVPDWTRAIQLVGSDPSGNPVLVALDADGNIIAIMKATYSGVLKNVACDAEGRMIMIPTDPADVWGNAISMGNAALAAALGFTHRFDRRGDILMADSFEAGFSQCFTTAVGTEAKVEVSTFMAAFGGFSVKLTGGTTSDGEASLQYYRGFIKKTRLGLEMVFSLNENYKQVNLRLVHYDGTYSNEGWIAYDAPNTKWIYRTTGGAWADLVTGVTLYPTTRPWYPLKVVIDPTTGKYVRALLPDRVVDMSAYALNIDSDPVSPYVMGSVGVYSVLGVKGIIYVDNVIITQNEPA